MSLPKASETRLENVSTPLRTRKQVELMFGLDVRSSWSHQLKATSRVAGREALACASLACASLACASLATSEQKLQERPDI